MEVARRGAASRLSGHAAAESDRQQSEHIDFKTIVFMQTPFPISLYIL
jgi:hypothetical protein